MANRGFKPNSAYAILFDWLNFLYIFIGLKRSINTRKRSWEDQIGAAFYYRRERNLAFWYGCYFPQSV